MLHKGMSRPQVEEVLRGKGDFVQIDYLTKFLREETGLEMKKYTCLKLAEIYERRNMLDNAAKMLENAARVSTLPSEKIRLHLREAEFYIKTGNFDSTSKAVEKAKAIANASEKAEIDFHIKRFYLHEAEIYEMEMKRNHAIKVYEKLLKTKLSGHEEKEIKQKLILLYEKLGKFREAENLKKDLDD